MRRPQRRRSARCSITSPADISSPTTASARVARSFQPMNINYGLIPDLDVAADARQGRQAAQRTRARPRKKTHHVAPRACRSRRLGSATTPCPSSNDRLSEPGYLKHRALARSQAQTAERLRYRRRLMPVGAAGGGVSGACPAAGASGVTLTPPSSCGTVRTDFASGIWRSG